MATRSELLELARLMEREERPFRHQFEGRTGHTSTLRHGMHDWDTIIEALRIAAETKTPA